MNKQIEITLSAISTGFGIQMLPFWENMIDPDWLGMVVAAIIGGLLFHVFSVIYSIPMRFHQLRRLVGSKYGIEGYWFERVYDSPSHPYSFAWIRYRSDKQKFSYKGLNLCVNFSPHARWISSALITEEGNDRIHFLFDADIIRGTEEIRGHGVLEFSHYIGKVYTSASGSFVDDGSNLRKRMFMAERVPGRFVKKILGRTSIRSDDDIIQVIKAIVKEKKLPYIESDFEGDCVDNAPTGLVENCELD